MRALIFHTSWRAGLPIRWLSTRPSRGLRDISVEGHTLIDSSGQDKALVVARVLAYEVDSPGIFFMPCEIKEKSAYTQGERGKIERLVAARGKSYKSAKGAR